MKNVDLAVLAVGVLSGVCVILVVMLLSYWRSIKNHYDHEISMTLAEKRLALICGWAKPIDHLWGPVIEELKPESASLKAQISCRFARMMNTINFIYFLEKHAKENPEENLRARVEELLGHKITYLSALKILLTPVPR